MRLYLQCYIFREQDRPTSSDLSDGYQAHHTIVSSRQDTLHTTKHYIQHPLACSSYKNEGGGLLTLLCVWDIFGGRAVEVVRLLEISLF